MLNHHTKPSGGEIRRRREALGVSREQLAHDAGICASTLVRFEYGKTEPISLVRQAILDALARLEANRQLTGVTP